jgi:hypothetical protein
MKVSLTRGVAMLLALLMVPMVAGAQAPTGRLVGKVVDGDAKLPIGGARIEVVGSSTLRTNSNVDGRYVLRNIPAGVVTLKVSMIGYAPTTVTGIRITADSVSEQDISLGSLTVELQELTVTAAVAQGSVNAALDEQRNSIAIVNAVSSEQIARSPDGDAAAAVQRVSGATVQDGKYVFVRGLGDRYTTASLNGARIPSPEPEKKVVPLDLFPSSLLSGITTSKTFTPDQPGDFSGASVNIKTKEFTGQRFLAFSVSTGFNDAVTGQDAFFSPSTSRDWLALGANARSLPESFRAVDFTQSLPNSTTNTLVNSLRNNWSARGRTGAPNGGFGGSIAGSIPTGGTGLNYLVSGTYSFTQEIRAGQQALAAAVSSAEAEEIDRFEGTTGRNSVLWGGIANLSTAIGSGTKITLNNSYNRTMDNEGRRESGYSENLAIPLQIQRLRYVERNVYSSQLGFLHSLDGGRQTIEWGVTASGVSRQEPDRSEVVYSVDDQGRATWFGFSNEAAVRTFADLSENAIEGNANWQLALGRMGSGALLRVGGLYRSVDRDAVNTAYSISLNRPLPDNADAGTPEEIFDGRFSGENDTFFRVTPLAAGGSYTASDRLAAGYAMVSLPLSSSIDIIAGARFESSRVEVASLSTAGEPSLATPEFNDLLPSLAVTWRMRPDMNLRASATQTLSRPEYRELSPILFREVIGYDNVRGNADLQRALIRNFDLRWEFYPSRGEILSVGVFAKDFDNPIERVYQGTSGTRIITYTNALGASNYGVELEARKALGIIGLETVTAFANATVMQSQIELDPNAGSVTNSERKMVGQSPYVLNGGITWSHPTSDASATVLFNRVGERIVDAGELPLPDVVEKPRNVLDVSFRLPVFSTLSARVDAKNLLDAPYQITQGSVIRERYTAGRILSVGFSWRQ